MNEFLPKTKHYLRQFQKVNKELFCLAKRDFKPSRESYGVFDEADEVYSIMSTLCHSVRDLHLFEGGEIFVTPLDLINDIKTLHKAVKEDLDKLIGIASKYNDKIPTPILNTIKYHQLTFDTLDFILKLDEVILAEEPSKYLKMEETIKQLEFEHFWLKERKIYSLPILKYVLVLIIILILLYLQQKYNTKFLWLTIIVGVLPFLDSLIRKDKITDSILYYFSSKKREQFKKDAFEKFSI